MRARAVLPLRGGGSGGGCCCGGQGRERDKLARSLVLVLHSAVKKGVSPRRAFFFGPFRGTHHIERDDAALPDDLRHVLALRKLLQDRQAVARRDPTERLGRLVPDHVLLVRSPEDIDQGRDRVGRRELAEHERNLVPGAGVRINGGLVKTFPSTRLTGKGRSRRQSPWRARGPPPGTRRSGAQTWRGTVQRATAGCRGVSARGRRSRVRTRRGRARPSARTRRAGSGMRQVRGRCKGTGCGSLGRQVQSVWG